MKQIKYTWLACLFIILTASQCKKDKDPVGQLPPETQSGANTFGCLVNGAVFVPRGSDGYSGTNIKASYQLIYSSDQGYSFIISATDYKNSPIPFIVLGADSVKISQGMILKTAENRGGGAARYRLGTSEQNNYGTVGTLPGEIIIKRFDESLQIASGTFWFDAINSFGEIIHITQGRFDVKYTL